MHWGLSLNLPQFTIRVTQLELYVTLKTRRGLDSWRCYFKCIWVVIWDVSFNLELLECWEYFYLRYILVESNFTLFSLSVVKVLGTTI